MMKAGLGKKCHMTRDLTSGIQPRYTRGTWQACVAGGMLGVLVVRLSLPPNDG
jgi:hypothetical protein